MGDYCKEIGSLFQYLSIAQANHLCYFFVYKGKYEVCNHLGNVLVTLTDRRLQHTSNSSTVDWYEAEVTTVQDYYAFGAPMPGRSWKDSITERKDSCVSCALLKAKMKSYYTTNGDTGIKNKTHIAQYLNAQFGFSQSGDAYFSAIQNCGLLKQWVRGVNALDDTYPYLFDFGYQSQYKVGAGNFTVEAWINITDTQSTSNTIIESIADSASFTKTAGFNFVVHGTRLQTDLYWRTGSGSVFSTGHMSINTWHHVAFVKSGPSNSSTYTFYVDGAAHGTGSLGNINLDPRTGWNNDGMSIMGCYYLSKKYSYQFCKLRDVRMHTRALSSTELSNVYSHPCDAPDTTNLKLWLPLKSYYTSVSHSGYAEGTYPGSTIKDYSKYGATGTYVKNTSRSYDIAWDWTFDTTCFVNGTAVCQWKDYKVADGYRFGFNGMEKDDEVSGEGDDYTAEFWEYDARLGRRMNLDPIRFAFRSPYSCFANNPLVFADPSGLVPENNEGNNESDDQTKSTKGGEIDWERDCHNTPPQPTGGNSNGEKVTQTDCKKSATSMRNFIGRDDYYLERYKDYMVRNNFQCKPTNYYLNYGNKYIRKFKYETRSTLSDDGKKWLDGTLDGLQYGIEGIVMMYPGIESNDELFMQLAFGMHPDVYIINGILKLSILDKVKIALTVDPEDLLSPLGIQQAQRVALEQGEFYLHNNNALQEQMAKLFLYGQVAQIEGMVAAYIIAHHDYFVNQKTVKKLYEVLGLPVNLKF